VEEPINEDSRLFQGGLELPEGRIIFVAESGVCFFVDVDVRLAQFLAFSVKNRDPFPFGRRVSPLEDGRVPGVQVQLDRAIRTLPASSTLCKCPS